MDTIIIGGFLGSGKTTTLLALARHAAQKGHSVAIIENEIGKVSIDDGVIEREGFMVQNLFAGCVCCTLTGDLCACVDTIARELQPDLLIVESTGIAFPEKIRETLQRYLQVPSRTLLIVDAQRWQRISRAMEHLVIQQLENAACVLINKADAVPADVLAAVEADIVTRCPDARVWTASAREGLDDATCEVILYGESLA